MDTVSGTTGLNSTKKLTNNGTLNATNFSSDGLEIGFSFYDLTIIGTEYFFNIAILAGFFLIMEAV